MERKKISPNILSWCVFVILVPWCPMPSCFRGLEEGRATAGSSVRLSPWWQVKQVTRPRRDCPSSGLVVGEVLRVDASSSFRASAAPRACAGWRRWRSCRARGTSRTTGRAPASSAASRLRTPARSGRSALSRSAYPPSPARPAAAARCERTAEQKRDDTIRQIDDDDVSCRQYRMTACGPPSCGWRSACRGTRLTHGSRTEGRGDGQARERHVRREDHSAEGRGHRRSDDRPDVGREAVSRRSGRHRPRADAHGDGGSGEGFGRLRRDRARPRHAARTHRHLRGLALAAR